jgi:RND family efflux transporter MFP subunit
MQPVWYEAVGSIAPATTIAVAPQVNGRILEMLVDVGQKVTAGTMLFRVDDRTIQAQVAQAQAGITAAKASAEQATAAKARVDRLFAREAATPEQVEAASAASAQAQAAVAAAEQALVEAQTYLSYAEVVSPIDGVIAERLARAGDLALPGQAVLQIHGGVEMDFVAAIRESKIDSLSIGSEVQVDFPTPALRVPAVVHELHPAGDPNTRSFTIKASLPAMKLLRPGMYGKLMLQTGELEVTVIPIAALSRVGQLETVMVQTDGGWQRRFVRVGSEVEGGYFEILAGLSDGETIGWIQ